MSSKGGRVRAVRSDARLSRAALLKAARALMAARGPEALTVVAVAQGAGLNRSTAYQHFRTREQLLAAVARDFAEELRRLFREPRGFGERVDFFVQHFLDHPDIARIWMFQLLAGRSEIPPGWGEYVAEVERMTEGARSGRGVDAEMLGVIGMSSALVWSLMAGQRTESEAQARRETDRFRREFKRLYLFGRVASRELAGARRRARVVLTHREIKR